MQCPMWLAATKEVVLLLLYITLVLVWIVMPLGWRLLTSSATVLLFFMLTVVITEPLLNCNSDPVAAWLHSLPAARS